MPATHSIARRPLLAVCLVGSAAVCLLNGALGFVGVPAARVERTRVVAHVSAGYLDRNGPKDSDVAFDAAAATGASADVEFKKRPFGILRYQPGKDGKGAMAMEIIPKSRYPGDPQGQAFISGVKGGWVASGSAGRMGLMFAVLGMLRVKGCSHSRESSLP